MWRVPEDDHYGSHSEKVPICSASCRYDHLASIKEPCGNAIILNSLCQIRNPTLLLPLEVLGEGLDAFKEFHGEGEDDGL